MKSFYPRAQLDLNTSQDWLSAQPRKVHFRFPDFQTSVSPRIENECCKCQLAKTFVGGR